jgi:cyclopropane-fatty-acyl-phospholipid synthase
MEHSPPANAPAAEKTESDRAPRSTHRAGLVAVPAPPRREQRQSGSLGVERQLLRRLLQRLGHPPVAFSLWDGREIAAGDGVPQVRLRVADRATLWRLAVNPMLQFGEAYSDGTLEIEGGLLHLLRLVQSRLVGPHRANFRPRRLFRRNGRRRNTLNGSRENIHQHYDIGNDFYKLWLDERMLYTCAYYRDPRMTLEEAQVAKMDHVCRKLQLRPGETVIEAGCGWGGFALHMARNYGVTVRAFNISREQIIYAREAARREDLDDRVEFVQDDWRNITGTCDAFVSIGMLEHVGLDNYRELGEVIDRSLVADGRGLIHSIGRNYPEPLNAWTERRIFPGAQPPTIREMMEIFEHRNLSVLDLENIRLHYAVTLRHWLERYEEHVDVVRDLFDERFVRMWRLYLASSMVAFEYGSLQLFQVLFAPGRSNTVPWTRAYQYVDGEHAEPGAAWGEVRRD